MLEVIVKMEALTHIYKTERNDLEHRKM